MMIARPRRITTCSAARLAMLALISVLGVAANAQPLRNDPFARPRLGSEAALASSADGPPAAEPAPPWQPELRGVMQAGAASLANVGGRVVTIGESVDGWRLVRVDDGTALFVHGRRQTILSMNNAGQNKR